MSGFPDDLFDNFYFLLMEVFLYVCFVSTTLSMHFLLKKNGYKLRYRWSSWKNLKEFLVCFSQLIDFTEDLKRKKFYTAILWIWYALIVIFVIQFVVFMLALAFHQALWGSQRS